MKRFDAIIIGGGQAGPSLALRFAAAGQTVAIIERHLFGGTCVNTGCMPSKTLVASARAAHVARRAADYGVVLAREVGFDWARARARAEAVVSAARAGIESSLAGNARCTVVRGHARFLSPHAVQVADETLQAARIFVNVGLASGRRPNTDDLRVERAGIAVDAAGYIVVDDHLRTNVPGIWALGECNGRGAFTHTAYNDHEIVAANLIDDQPRKVSDRIDAYAIYLDPPLARIGLTADAARRATRPHLVGQRPMTRVSPAFEKGETQGFMRVIVDAETRRIAGATIRRRRWRRGDPRDSVCHLQRRDRDDARA